jgi:general secretion pathway protein B
MSYILDALKKADSERQHGKTPDIHTQPTHNNALDGDESVLKKSGIWIILVVALIILCSALLAMNWQRTSATVAVAPAPVPAPAPPLAAVAPVVAAPVVTAPPVIAPSAEPAPVNTQQTAPAIAQPSMPAQANPEPKTTATTVSTPKEKRHASIQKTQTTKKSREKDNYDPAIETITTTLRDLPLNIQNEIPTITVGGYLYSDNRAECQLIINKMLLHEGDQVMPGMMLERMMPHSAILNYKGYRYRIAY